MSSVAERLIAVKRRMADACARAGRSPDSVKLIAVSKKQPAALIREAYLAGQRDFGENYAQELRDKAKELEDLPGIRWHAIGPLQTNKAKYVAAVASHFHALERLDVAQELSRRRGPDPLACFVEVNMGEATKSGLAPENVGAFLKTLGSLENLRVLGLMALPPLEDDPERARAHFRRLRALAQRHGLSELSMGTTADFEAAIEEGASWVRVGTAIFGERPTSP